MAIRSKTFTPNTILKASELNDIAANGVVQIATSADLSDTGLLSVNMVYVVNEAKVRVRKTAGTGIGCWSDPFDGGGNAALVGFTGTSQYTIPSGCKSVDLLIVGGGGNGINDTTGGTGGQVVLTTKTVSSGNVLTISIGGAAAASSVIGPFGTVTANGAAGAVGSADGTYVSGWGWYGGGGGNRDVVYGQAQISKRVGYGGGGVGAAAWGGIATAAQAGAPNSGGGGGAANASGGSGFVGIFVR